MGWFSISKKGKILREDQDGRPVKAGEDGELAFIGQEDYGHKVGVDLLGGNIIIDWEGDINVQNGTIEIGDSKTIFTICDETNIVGDLVDVVAITEPDINGWYQNVINPIPWRPIWFSRVTNGIPTKVIGAQATLPEQYGGKNIKKLVSLFVDGRIGID